MSGMTPCCSNAQKCVPDAAEAGLHFVGNAHAARSAHGRYTSSEISRRQHDLPADARAGFRDVADSPRPLAAHTRR